MNSASIIVIYEGTNNEYYSFVSRECTQAIDDYIAYRIRCNEKLRFNAETRKWEPEDAPLLRVQFDANDVLQARHPTPMKNNAIRRLLAYHLVKCGLRTIEHSAEPNSTKRIRKAVALGNGFRKFAISSFVRAKVNHDIRQLLVDHKGGYLDENYLRLTEDEILEEYMKAEPYLTVDPNVRLSQENKILKLEVSKVDGVMARLAEMEKRMGLE
jgi:hypothetical protein